MDFFWLANQMVFFGCVLQEERVYGNYLWVWLKNEALRGFE
jgi:hypothetical protein